MTSSDRVCSCHGFTYLSCCPSQSSIISAHVGQQAAAVGPRRRVAGEVAPPHRAPLGAAELQRCAAAAAAAAGVGRGRCRHQGCTACAQGTSLYVTPASSNARSKLQGEDTLLYHAQMCCLSMCMASYLGRLCAPALGSLAAPVLDTKVVSWMSTVSQPWCTSAPLFGPAAQHQMSFAHHQPRRRLHSADPNRLQAACCTTSGKHILGTRLPGAPCA